MRSTSKVARHQFYNLFQNLKMSPIRTIDAVTSIPAEPGAFIFWLDEAPPRCLYVGTVSPKIEDGLLKWISDIVKPTNTKSELQQSLTKDTKLSREYKTDLKKPENREQFIHDHIYFQYLTIPDMKADEMKSFEEFLEAEAELNPRYHHNSTPAGKR